MPRRKPIKKTKNEQSIDTGSMRHIKKTGRRQIKRKNINKTTTQQTKKDEQNGPQTEEG